MNTDLTVRQLRWILTHATDDTTIPEALSQLADNERREADAVAHNDRQRVYFEYLERRREREREQVQQAADDAKKAAIASGPISRERASVVYKEAADLERLRFGVREPRLEFQPKSFRPGSAENRLPGRVAVWSRCGLDPCERP